MYIFDLNRGYNWPIVAQSMYSSDCRSDMYIPVCHANGRYIKNMIGMVLNRLVGMGCTQNHIVLAPYTYFVKIDL